MPKTTTQVAARTEDDKRRGPRTAEQLKGKAFKRRELEPSGSTLWNAIASANLRRLRIEANLTIEGLAKLMGVSIPLVQQHERGRSRMNAGQIKIYADLLGVSVVEFYAKANIDFVDDALSSKKPAG